REPDSLQAVIAEIQGATGESAEYDAHARRLKNWFEPGAITESSARRFAEDLALAFQGAALRRYAPDYVFDGFCKARLNPEVRSYAYGALPKGVDLRAITSRASVLQSA
ncbi:MAG TPA: hypothetical protein PK585_04140, partial [Amphiplicatus sp.]|nr:hypothetical protein [Amphiplicatus sp.]